MYPNVSIYSGTFLWIYTKTKNSNFFHILNFIFDHHWEWPSQIKCYSVKVIWTLLNSVELLQWYSFQILGARYGIIHLLLFIYLRSVLVCIGCTVSYCIYKCDIVQRSGIKWYSATIAYKSHTITYKYTSILWYSSVFLLQCTLDLNLFLNLVTFAADCRSFFVSTS